MDVHRTAHNGRWIVGCEARTLPPKHAQRGPRGHDKAVYPFALYLFRGGGDGQRIDELVAASPDDRWLVVYRGDELVLVDDRDGRETTLFRDASRTYEGFHQVADFDSTSRHLVYFRLTGGGSTVTVRTLATQAERTISIPGRSVSRVVPEPTGSWARLLFAREGEKDTSWGLPYPPLSDEDRPWVWEMCNRPRAAEWRLPFEGDQLWLDIEHATTRSAPDELAHLGPLVIRRNPDGALAFGDKEVVPANCDPAVYAVSVSPPRIVADCRGNSLNLFGPGLAVTLGQARSINPRTRTHPALTHFIDKAYACLESVAVCIAIEDGAVVALKGGRGVGGTNVVSTSQHARFFATGPRVGQQIPNEAHDPWQNFRHEGDIHLIGSVMIDVASEQVLGKIDANPVAIDSAGRALMASGEENQVHQAWLVGPLRWVTPTPVLTP